MRDHPIDATGAPPDPEGRALVGWLATVTLEGSAEPVRVMLDGRDGHRVFVRQIDPRDGEPLRVPLYAGDELVVMTVVAGIGAHTTADVGRTDDFLFGSRVVPVRREPGRVFARTLRRDEVDDGTRVHVRPGDELVFEEGSVVAELDAIDDQGRAAATGFTSLTPVLWTWLSLRGDRDEGAIRYLLAAARRLDEAARLLGQVEGLRAELDQEGQPGPTIRRALFALVGATELAIVALGRVVDMAGQAPILLGMTVQLPESVTAKSEAIREIRNAYEHIEDRAFGRIFKASHPEVLTIFDHYRLVEENVIDYRGHTLNLVTEVPQLLAALRQFFKDVAGTV